MDVVYPLKEGKLRTGELKYSLRSLQNLPHERVFLVGGNPNWVQNVKHIPTKQLPYSHKYRNVCGNIEAACLSEDVSDPFIVFNDDFFVMEPTKAVGVNWRETPDEAVERYERLGMADWRHHLLAIQGQLALEGYWVQRSYELHIPMVIHKSAMLEALDKAEWGPLWRTAYATVAALEGDRMVDVKVMQQRKLIPAGRWVSTADKVFQYGQAGRQIKAAFRDKSPYEV